MTLLIALLEAFQSERKFQPEGIYFGTILIDLAFIESIWGFLP